MSQDLVRDRPHTESAAFPLRWKTHEGRCRADLQISDKSRRENGSKSRVTIPALIHFPSYGFFLCICDPLPGPGIVQATGLQPHTMLLDLII